MKRKENGEGTIRLRPDGRWEARLYTDSGRISIYGLSSQEVRRKLSAMRGTIENGEYAKSSSLTVEEWILIWEKDHLDVKPGTLRRYDGDIRNHIIPALGMIILSQLKVADVEKACREWRKEGLSAKSVKNAHGVLHSALDKAVESGLIKKNVSSGCNLPKGQQDEMRPLEDEEVAVFLKLAKEDLLYPLYYIALFTGMRQSELMGLTWDCINFRKGTIHITKQLLRINAFQHKGEYHFVPTKTNKQRIIEPAYQVMEMLREVQKRQTEWKEQCGDAWKGEDDLVFTNPDGTHLSNSNVYRHFKRIMKQMSLNEVRFHDLRHTYAVLALQNGIDIKTVSASLGHYSVAFTMDKYGHVSNTMRKMASEKIGYYIEGLGLTPI